MREILFRGKQKSNGNWVHGDLSYHRDGRVFIRCWDRLDFDPAYNAYEVNPETVGQFTGLTDKNGKKIFEGDVFEFPDEIFESYYTSCGTEYNSWEIKNYGVVGYNEDYGRYDFVQYKFDNNAVETDLHENKYLEFADFVNVLEVIGNIYDNPELLEV